MTAANPPVARLQLGQLLRELRESAGKKRDDAADVLECQVPKISKIETGRATISAGDVRLLIDLYGINGETADTVLTLARQARKRSQVRVPDWARRFVAMENVSQSIRMYEAELVPGLLQTEDYIRASARSFAPEQDESQVDRIVSVRTERQSRLTSEDPPSVSAVINEAVLRRPVGGHHIMRRQLEHLRQLSDLPRVTLQILPFSAGAHPAMGSCFTMLGLREPGGVKLVYVEDLFTADYLDGLAQIERYSQVFERLQIAALGEVETTAMLDRAIREFT